MSNTFGQLGFEGDLPAGYGEEEAPAYAMVAEAPASSAEPQGPAPVEPLAPAAPLEPYDGLFDFFKRKDSSTDSTSSGSGGFLKGLFDKGVVSASAPEFVTVPGEGGYIYKLWPNGDVAIVEGTISSTMTKEGWVRGQPGPRTSAAYRAILNEVGTYEQNAAEAIALQSQMTQAAAAEKQAKKQARTQSVMSAASQLLPVFQSLMASPEEELSLEETTAEEGTNWLLVGGVVVGLVAVGGILYWTLREKPAPLEE